MGFTTKQYDLALRRYLKKYLDGIPESQYDFSVRAGIDKPSDNRIPRNIQHLSNIKNTKTLRWRFEHIIKFSQAANISPAKLLQIIEDSLNHKK